jgi:ElaB/YqjD/DUF883 family membrane-anchored ribosome-binding protein
MATMGTGPSTGTTTSGGGDTAAQAKDKAQAVAGQAQEKAQEAAGQARDRVREQVDQRSTEYGQRITSQASDLRSVGDQLRQQGKDGPARIADQAAQRIERAGSWLTEADADRILGDVEDFARRNPWAVMAGGLALGFVTSRFLKASSTDRFEQRSSAGQIPRRTSEPRFQRDTMGVGTGVTPPPPVVPPTPSGTVPTPRAADPERGI